MKSDEIDFDSVHPHELKRRADKLAWILRQIKTKMIEIGQHLKEIRDEKLYAPKFKSFEDFCREEFGFGNKRANQIISAETLRLQMSGQVANDPELSKAVPKLKEAHLRVLAKIPEDKRIEVLRSIGSNATAKAIESAVSDKRLDNLAHKVGESFIQNACTDDPILDDEPTPSVPSPVPRAEPTDAEMIDWLENGNIDTIHVDAQHEGFFVDGHETHVYLRSAIRDAMSH